MHHDIITIRMTPYDHLSAHRQALRAAQALYQTAPTARDRSIYKVWILNAERNIDKWQAQIDKEKA